MPKLAPYFLIVLLAVGVFVAITRPSQSQTGNLPPILVENADNVATIGFTPSQSLGDLLLNLVSFPQVANNKTGQNYPLIIPPIGMGTLSQWRPKITLGSAETSRFVAFGYPTTLINDTVAPEIELVEIITQTNQARAIIKFTTNEFTIASVHYGTEADVYSFYAIDDFYALNHEIILESLQQDTIYYFRIFARDRSSNTRRSSEMVLALQPQADTVAPEITLVAVITNTSQAQATIKFTTNEPAQITVSYGTTSGAYYLNVIPINYAQVHEVILSNLELNTPYYYQITATDKSENKTISEEMVLVLHQTAIIDDVRVYLPLVIK